MTDPHQDELAKSAHRLSVAPMVRRGGGGCWLGCSFGCVRARVCANACPAVPLLVSCEQMQVTDRHYRFMMRLLTKRTKLYTEMHVDETVSQGGRPVSRALLLRGH